MGRSKKLHLSLKDYLTKLGVASLTFPCLTSCDPIDIFCNMESNQRINSLTFLILSEWYILGEQIKRKCFLPDRIQHMPMEGQIDEHKNEENI